MSLGSGEGLPFAPIVEALRRLPGIIAAGEAGTIRDIDELRLPETNDLGRLLPSSDQRRPRSPMRSIGRAGSRDGSSRACSSSCDR